MVSCVASVEVQLRVVESPVLMEVGLACSETVGRAAAGGGGGGGGGAFGTGFLQPATKASARMALSMAPRYRELETRIIRILLNVRIPFWSHQRQHPITMAFVCVRCVIYRSTMYLPLPSLLVI